MIEVKVTIGGEITTFTMTVEEWVEKRDAQFGVAPLDDELYKIISDKVK